MKIDINSRYSEVADLYRVLTDESKEAIKAEAVKLYGEYWDMTIGDYFALDRGDCSKVALNGEPTLVQYVWLEGLTAFTQEFAKALKSVQIPKTMQRKFEDQARNVCIKVDVRESILDFTQRSFYLHSYREAENITLAEYMIKRRAEFNSIMMQRRMEQLQMANINKKSK